MLFSLLRESFTDLFFLCSSLLAAWILAALRKMTSSMSATQASGPSPAPDTDDRVDGEPVFKKIHYDKISVNDRGAIRILRVHAASSEHNDVVCELIPGTILDYKDCKNHDPPLEFKPYDALSWCWGKGPQDGKINIRLDGVSYVKRVQPSVVSALRAFRHTNSDRHIWVDAICINQDYKPEKNRQVEMMADIYGRADCVRIWLGDLNTSSKLAILFIKQEVLQLDHFDDLCRSSEFSEKWKSLLELMQREWFSRRWVVQEVALAPKAIIHCGPAKLSWSKFAVAVELFVEAETATHRLSEVRANAIPLTIHLGGFYGKYRLETSFQPILINPWLRCHFHNFLSHNPCFPAGRWSYIKFSNEHILTSICV